MNTQIVFTVIFSFDVGFNSFTDLYNLSLNLMYFIIPTVIHGDFLCFIFFQFAGFFGIILFIAALRILSKIQ